MSFFIVFLFFVIWRVFDFAVLYFSPRFISYLGFFPYVSELKKFHLPQWIYSLANFDGVHYIKIAQQGYEQYEQAFFPLYPILIKLVGQFFHNNFLVAGLFISNIFFLLGLYFLSKYLLLYYSLRPSQILWCILFLLLFPTSFFFSAVYTEGLFFFLVITSLYFLEKKNYLLVSLFGFLASLTRFMGVFLIIPFIIHLFQKQAKSSRQTKLNNLRGYLAFLFPLLGLLAYGLYLWKTTGDPFFFLNSQPIFGAHRSTSIILLPQVYFRYTKILLTAQFDFQYFISLFEFSIFTFVFIVLILQLLILFLPKVVGGASGRAPDDAHPPAGGEHRREGNSGQDPQLIGLNLFSLANLLLPTLTGTFSSVPRYALLSISFFVFLGRLQSKIIKILLGIIFFLLHIIILGYFGQGYFVG